MNWRSSSTESARASLSFSAVAKSSAIIRPRIHVVQQAFVDEGIELFAGTKLQHVSHDRSAGSRSSSSTTETHPPHGRPSVSTPWGANPTRRRARSRRGRRRHPRQGPNRHQPLAADQCVTSMPPAIVRPGGDRSHCDPAGRTRRAPCRGREEAPGPVDYSLCCSTSSSPIRNLPPSACSKGPRQRATCPISRKLSVQRPLENLILMDANYGYVKVIAEPKHGRIIGAEIVGRDAGELISRI